MKTIYRHKLGFRDGTDRIEIENGIAVAVLNTGKTEPLTLGWDQLAESFVERGTWKKEVVQ